MVKSLKFSAVMGTFERKKKNSIRSSDNYRGPFCLFLTVSLKSSMKTVPAAVPSTSKSIKTGEKLNPVICFISSYLIMFFFVLKTNQEVADPNLAL